MIETLPIQKQSEDPDLITLKGYTADKQSIEDNWGSIRSIISRKPEYESYFYQRMGEVYTRVRRKELKGEGIVKGWFALLGWKIVAGGKTREIAEEAALGIIPPEKKNHLYFFEINEKKKGR